MPFFPMLELRGDLDWTAPPNLGGQCHISITFVPWETTGTVCGFSVNTFDVAFPEHIVGVGHLSLIHISEPTRPY